MVYIERTDYNKVISIKLMIPGTCNAKCTFCYMKDYKSSVLKNQKDEFLNNYLSSLNKIISKIGDKNPISLDITGNEPTFDKLIYSRKDIDLSADIKELENRIQSKEHTPEYYFNAGVIARGYLDEIHKNGDAVNAYIGGLNQFCWLIGLDNEEDDDDENN